MIEGDLVEFPREFYSYLAVHVGNGDVVHLTGNTKDNIGVLSVTGQRCEEASVKREKFLDVADQSKALINNRKDKTLKPQPAEQIVKEPTLKVGKHTGYNFIWHNCEHFASWCRYGLEESQQSDRAFSVLVDVVQPIVMPGPAGELTASEYLRQARR